MEAMFYVAQCFFVIFTGKDEPDTIGPEGVEKLCKDLGVEPEDVRMLKLFCSSHHSHGENVAFYRMVEEKIIL